MDTRSKPAIWMDALQRLAMATVLARPLSLYILTEYPKSGGTWIAQMLSEYLQLPFPRNQRPRLESCLLHGHMLPMFGMNNVVVVYRDGRDVMVSLYFHMLFVTDRNAPGLVERTRRELGFRDCEDVKENLPTFIQYIFEREGRSASPYHFTWPRFVSGWHGRGAVEVRYEDAAEDAFTTMKTALRQLGVSEIDESRLLAICERYSFANQSRRSQGEEDRGSFLRKGQPGDWKEKFSYKAGCLFEELAGHELRTLGYVADRSWPECLRVSSP